jgi:PTS system cellobiose-specific IIC component
VVTPKHWIPVFLDAYHVGFGVMGIVLAGCLADRLARNFGYSRLAGIIVTLAAFFVSMPLPIPHNPVIAMSNIASSSLFLALIVGLVAGEVFRLAKIRMRKTVAIVAATLATGILFGGLAALLASSHHSIADVLLLYFIKPLIGVGDTLPVLLLVVFLQTLLWSTGVHGPAFLAAVTTPIFLGAIDQNGQALRHGLLPPHIVTLSFFAFVYPGGSGATMPLSFLMLRSKIPRLRKLGLATLLPTVINVNEPLIFGVPLVMNPTLAIPFVGVPLVLAIVSYLATWLGLVDRTVYYLPGSLIPSPINVWLTTNGDWRAVALIFINIGIAFVLYLPFYRSFEEATRRAPAVEEQLVKTAEHLREHLEPGHNASDATGGS